MPGIYLPEPYPDEMDQSRDWKIRQDEFAAAQVGQLAGDDARDTNALSGSRMKPPRPVFAANPDKLGADVIADLKDFRADQGRMKRLLWTLAITAIFMLAITVHTLTFQSEVISEQIRNDVNTVNAIKARHYSDLVAACMRGDQFIWVDPHTGADMAAFCNVEILGRIGR